MLNDERRALLQAAEQGIIAYLQTVDGKSKFGATASIALVPNTMRFIVQTKVGNFPIEVGGIQALKK